jgi:Immunity protein Imm1
MYVRRLSIEDERILDPSSPELDAQNPSWDQIENGIHRLDGKYRTLLIIGQDNPEFDYMVIGGGKEGAYWCGLYDKTGREFVVIDPSQTSTMHVKVPTGQTTSVPIRETVDLETVIIAAKKYSESGERASELVWEER